MEPYEYIVVLTSIILSLGIAQILNGTADMVANFKKIKFSYTHTVLIAVVFLVYIQDWFYSYNYSKLVEVWDLPNVLFLFSFPIVLFLESRFLFPTGTRSMETDMDKYFYENWRVIYSLFAITIAISIVQNYSFSGLEFIEQIPLFIYLAVYLMFIIGRFKDRMLHKVFVTLQLVAWIFFVFFDETILTL
ncbi:MAG: hypothetical protein OCD76_02660 [Reichenbachiella sp.]